MNALRHNIRLGMLLWIQTHSNEIIKEKYRRNVVLTLKFIPYKISQFNI